MKKQEINGAAFNLRLGSGRRISFDMLECPCIGLDNMLLRKDITADEHKELHEALAPLHDAIKNFKYFTVKATADQKGSASGDCGCTGGNSSATKKAATGRKRQPREKDSTKIQP